MGELHFDTTKTAILMADFHAEGMRANPFVEERQVIANSRALLEAARMTGVMVIYIVVNFREGYPEISERNKIFGPRKTSGQSPAKDPVTLIDPEVSPNPGEIVVVKHRVGAFFGTDLAQILNAQDIHTLILLGHATRGVILSTVRYASDADYELVVVEDCCADRDQQVHNFLMEHIFPMQATVSSSQEVIRALRSK